MADLSDDDIEAIGHRKAFRYRHEKCEHESNSIYEFRRFTLIDFARAAIAADRALNAAQAAAEPVEMSPEFTDTSRAALLWVLWHHQGASSPVGQPLRFALGMGAHEHLNERQVAEAKRWAARTKSTTADFHRAAPVGQAERAGWRWVPVEATLEMTRAAVVYANGNAVYKNVAAEALKIEESIYAEVYEAMLAASPEPAEQLTKD